MLEEFTPLDVVHHEVDSISLLKDIVHSYKERVIYLVKDELLVFDVVNSIVLDNYVFPDALHRVVLIRFLAVDKVHLAESSPTNLFQ